jgi:hypothetical protein
MSGIIFLILGGIAAAGFLIVVWRRRQMPAILRVMLVIAAGAIVLFVGWTLAVMFTAAPAPVR